MLDGSVPADAPEGGSIPSLPVSFFKKSFEDKLCVLESMSEKQGHKKAWDHIVVPWLNQDTARMVMTNLASGPSAVTGGGGRGQYTRVDGDLPRCPVYQPATSSHVPLKENPALGTAVAAADSEHMPETSPDGNPHPYSVPAVAIEAADPGRKTLQDLVTSLKPGKPLQEVKYTAENIVWQGAAQRRRAHPRRTSVALGTCSVDLSGPHEPTPGPGGQVSKNPCHYFLALTLRPT